MTDSNSILASFGIQADVNPNPLPSVPAQEIIPTNALADYPTGLVTTLSLTAGISTMTLALLCFKFNRLLFALIRNSLTALGSERADLWFRLEYQFGIGAAIDTFVEYSSGPTPRIGNTSIPGDGIPAVAQVASESIELSEIVIT